MADRNFWIARVRVCPPEDLERLLFAWIDDCEDDAPEFWLDHLNHDYDRRCCEPTMRRVR